MEKHGRSFEIATLVALVRNDDGALTRTLVRNDRRGVESMEKHGWSFEIATLVALVRNDKQGVLTRALVRNDEQGAWEKLRKVLRS